MVRNPEVQKLSPALLAAIANPNKHAKAALAALLSTVFIHAVDAASLALIVPVVHRGLRDRSGDAKKRAGRIVGTMCALINEPKVRGALRFAPTEPAPVGCPVKAPTHLLRMAGHGAVCAAFDARPALRAGGPFA